MPNACEEKYSKPQYGAGEFECVIWGFCPVAVNGQKMLEVFTASEYEEVLEEAYALLQKRRERGMDWNHFEVSQMGNLIMVSVRDDEREYWEAKRKGFPWPWEIPFSCLDEEDFEED